MMSVEPGKGSELAAEVVAALREPGIVVPQDAHVWELIASWANAPSDTASGGTSMNRRDAQFEYVADLKSRLATAEAEVQELSSRIDSMVAAGPASDEAREMYLDEHTDSFHSIRRGAAEHG